MTAEILKESFYKRDTRSVARDLLGMKLVRMDGDKRIAGQIIETEAYGGEEDLGCHCSAGKTPRTQVMYGPPGRAYVYFVYGMHWMLNIVTEQEGTPGAVLIRGLIPLEGLDIIASRRSGQPRKHWLDGPAKICQAYNISGELNRVSVTGEQDPLFIVQAPAPESDQIHRSARVGLNSVPEPWKSIPWRFTLEAC